ncbi:MAG TPA: GNAT family N-acetyltransferase, partial [Ktedonobacterales bacterium]
MSEPFSLHGSASAAGPVTLRAAEYPRDAARTVAIYNTWSLEPTTVEAVMEQSARVVVGKRQHRLVALNAAGDVIGYAEATHTPWQSAGHYEVEHCVDRAWRGIGAGDALWSAMLARLRAEGAAQIEVQLRDNEP